MRVGIHIYMWLQFTVVTVCFNLASQRDRQSWQAHKGGRMDQEDWQHESRQAELPIELRMGQVFTYWRPVPEVSPDEGFWREAKTSINSTFGCISVISYTPINVLTFTFKAYLWSESYSTSSAPWSACLHSTFSFLVNSFGGRQNVHCCFVTETETAAKLHDGSVSAPKLTPNFGWSIP